MNPLTITVAVLTGAMLALVSAGPAFAQNPHFIGEPAIVKNPDFSPTASFKAAGLDNIVTDVFLTSSGVVADIQCVNPRGNNPPQRE